MRTRVDMWHGQRNGRQKKLRYYQATSPREVAPRPDSASGWAKNGFPGGFPGSGFPVRVSRSELHEEVEEG